MLDLKINQSVAILIDGNNIQLAIHSEVGSNKAMINFDVLVPDLLRGRSLSRLIYFREGKNISEKLQERLYNIFMGEVVLCGKNADVPLTIKAIELASKIDTLILLSGDSDYIQLVNYLKNRGVRVELACLQSSVSFKLKEECDFYHEITSKYWFRF